jgi:hypothetical protein
MQLSTLLYQLAELLCNGVREVMNGDSLYTSIRM